MRSNFEENSGGLGGAVSLRGGKSIIVSESNFSRNHASVKGGALDLFNSDAKIISCMFTANFVGPDDSINIGGALVINICNNVSISSSKFIRNKAKMGGATVINANRGVVTFNDNAFVENSAEYGGVLYVENSIPRMENVNTSDKSSVYIHNAILRNNRASQGGVVYFLKSTNYVSNTIIMGNKGSLFAHFSNVTLRNVTIEGGYTSTDTRSFKNITIEEGGAITAFQSRVTCEGNCLLTNNYVFKGGGIHATGSKFFVYGTMTVANNAALDSGGGIYLYQSELNCQLQCALKILSNNASHKGGGVYAISSSIITERYTSEIIFRNNSAMYAGGGICLEVNAKIYILMTSSSRIVLSFIANFAHYGGAVYVADETNSGVCASKSHNIHSTTTECFMQLLSLQLQHSNYYIPTGLAIVAKFVRNYAHISGSNLYGGLLDRCTNSPFTVRISSQPVSINVVVFYMNISVQQLNSISSGPVRVNLFLPKSR